MKLVDYSLEKPDDIISPALLYYKDALEKNLQSIIETAGGAQRLWPHIKSHKTRELVELSIRKGITRFKCATISEAEIAAKAGAEHVLVAYPLVGPNISRFIALSKGMSGTTFWAIGDDAAQLQLLADAARRAGIRVPVLLDVDMGMHRTGVTIEKAQALYGTCAEMEGLLLRGLHCYDGNNHQSGFEQRDEAVIDCDARIEELKKALQAEGLCCDTLIMGGTPSFPCHAKDTQEFLSPGTAFIFDAGYGKAFPDLNLYAAAAVLTRVISHPGFGMFTLDLGYKGIASDPEGSRGMLLGVPHAAALFQNEEHWVYQMEEGYEKEVPAIGSVLYVIPTHICPTSALYKSILVVENRKITEEWEVSARDRKLTY